MGTTVKSFGDLLAADGRRLPELAERMNIGLSTLYSWRAGERIPPPWKRKAAAKVLRVSRQIVDAAMAESVRRATTTSDGELR